MKRIKTNLKKAKNKFKLLNYSNDLPEFYAMGLPNISFFGNKQVQIEGVVGIMEYDENFIKVSVKKGYITFLGSDFKVTNFTKSQITVLGKINSTEFCF
ncbi:MAG: YabP/YqfC family sporulation protein [Clostridia bacterium]|nr:YabP/YqfC family sporulation protein [Clostridia bacterium]